MSESSLHHDEKARDCSTRDCGPRYVICDRWLVGLVLLTLIGTSEVFAGEQTAIPGAELKPDFNASKQRQPVSLSLLPLPATYQAVDLPESKIFPTAEFRPRGHSVLEKEPSSSSFDDAPMLHGTTVWQRLSDYRSHDHVRLLTLWETGGSTVSLLAGKKGEPSLQWTSRSMSRGGATDGLLDKFFSTSLAGAARGLHFSPHAQSADAPPKPSKLTDAGAGGPNK